MLDKLSTLFGITVFVFLIFNAMPGHPLSHMVDPSMSAEDIAYRLDQMGYNDPLPLRYVTWLKETLSGNLGFSTRYKRPVAELIGTRVGPTLLLTFSSMIISVALAVPLGVLSATRQYSKTDYTFTVLAMAGVSVPVFFLGVVFIKIVGFDLGLVPLGGMVTAGRSHANFFSYALDVGKHLIAPLTVLSVAGIASFMRFTRSSMLEVIRQDYIRTARAKGLSEKVVIYKHALRNAMIPVVTMLGLNVPFLFSGAVLTETVFVWPGMGTLNINALTQNDYPLLMGINLFFALMVLTGNFLADVLYAVVDPRIRYD
jgi:peptide/nickel transport system permease protein